MIPRSIPILAATVALLFPPSAATADPEERWAVVGLRTPESPALKQELEILRGFLGYDAAAKESGRLILRESATRSRLGLMSGGLEEIEQKIDGAELYYFQLELPLARESLEEALQALRLQIGPRATKRSRVARLLLATILLAENGQGAMERAAATIEPIARLHPNDGPDPRAYPAEMVALFGEVSRTAAATRKGWLRIDCEASCPEGHVWVDSYPLGAPGERIELPAGRYQVLVGDRFERPALRSLLREVEVVAGEEATILVDLAREGAVDPEGGPSFLIPDDGAWESAAMMVAGRLIPDPLVVLRRTQADGPRLHAALLEGGRIVREASASVEGGADPTMTLEQLANLLTSGSTEGEAATSGQSAADPVAAPYRSDRPSLDPRILATSSDPIPAWVEPTRWTTAGVAVAATVAGIWLHADASSTQRALSDRFGAAGAYGTIEEARAASREMDAARSQAKWGTGVLVGAGAAAVTTLVLFLLDWSEPAESPPPAPAR